MHYKAELKDARSIVDGQDGAPTEEDPAGYRPDPGLVDAVNVALILNRPLLLTGEPGTGKTQLAHSLAWQLAMQKVLDVRSPRVEKFETKSTSVSRDLFYTFDVVGRFQAAQSGAAVRNVDFVTYSALGRALLDALPRAQAAPYLPPGDPHDGPRRSVVLIDEIDKAPRDFPNDLLNEIDQMYFRVPEIGNVRIGGDSQRLRPIVVITSNSEKALPEPFLRRCVYYNIPFSTKRLEEILLARLPQLRAARGQLLDGALAFFIHVHERNIARRKISAAELLQWLTYMLRAGARPDDSLAKSSAHATRGLPALAKDPEDQERIAEELVAFMRGP